MSSMPFKLSIDLAGSPAEVGLQIVRQVVLPIYRDIASRSEADAEAMLATLIGAAAGAGARELGHRMALLMLLKSSLAIAEISDLSKPPEVH